MTDTFDYNVPSYFLSITYHKKQIVCLVGRYTYVCKSPHIHTRKLAHTHVWVYAYIYVSMDGFISTKFNRYIIEKIVVKIPQDHILFNHISYLSEVNGKNMLLN